MRSTAIVAFGLTAIALASTSIAEAQGQSALAPRIDSLFADYGAGTPGAVVVIVQDGELLYKQAYGMADLEHAIPVMSSTVFDIASLSKQFTGMAIAMLVEEGTISPDDLKLISYAETAQEVWDQISAFYQEHPQPVLPRGQ